MMMSTLQGAPVEALSRAPPCTVGLVRLCRRVCHEPRHGHPGSARREILRLYQRRADWSTSRVASAMWFTSRTRKTTKTPTARPCFLGEVKAQIFGLSKFQDRADDGRSAAWITVQCSLGIRRLPAIPLARTCGPYFGAPTPSAQANFGIPQAKCSAP